MTGSVTALNKPSPPYYQADNRLTHSSSVKIYNPLSVLAYTHAQRAHCAVGISEECIHRLDGMTECLCKDSEASG